MPGCGKAFDRRNIALPILIAYGNTERSKRRNHSGSMSVRPMRFTPTIHNAWRHSKLAANREERPTTDTYVAIASIKKAENKTKLVLQYPGIPICGLDLNDFVAAVRRAVGERNITVYLACNKPLGDRYRPQRDRMHFDAAAKARAEDLGNWGGGIAALNKWFNEGQPGVLAHQGTSFKSAYSYCN